MKSVEIEVDDNGQITVGIVPAEDENQENQPDDAGASPDAEPTGDSGGTEEAEEKSYMQPAKDIDSALLMAKQLLTSGAPAAPSQNDMWNQVQRDRAMQNQPGGPLMGQR